MQAARLDFQSSLDQLSQVHSRLAPENGEHVMRADVIMRDMDEMRKGLLEIPAEGRQNQGRLEASMASLNDLIKQRENLAHTRMAEMLAVMKERERQADERMKLMSDLMQRRQTDADTRKIDLMTTMKDLTLGVRAITSQTAPAQAKASPVPPMDGIPLERSTIYQRSPTTSTSDLLESGATQHRTTQTLDVYTARNIQEGPPKNKQNGESHPN